MSFVHIFLKIAFSQGQDSYDDTPIPGDLRDSGLFFEVLLK